MKKQVLVAALGAVFAASAACTFDFEAASDRLYGTDAGGANLLETAKWNPVARLSTYDIKPTDPRRTGAVKYVVRSEADGVHATENPQGILTAYGEAIARMMVSGWQTIVKMPDADGGRFALSFLYAMNHTLGHSGLVMVIPYVGRKPAWHEQLHLENIDSGEFAFNKTLTLPKGTDAVLLDFRLNALGHLRFWNASFRKLPPERPVVLRQAATGWFSPTFEISRGQSGVVCWHWKRGFDTPETALAGLRCALTVPPGFTLEGVSFGDSTKDVRTLPDGSTAYRIVPAGWLRPKASPSIWHRIGATLTTTNAVGARGVLRCQALGKDGTPLSDEATTELVVVPPVRAARPKRFVSGAEFGGAYWRTQDGRGLELMSKMCAEAGFAGVFCHGTTKTIAAAFRKAGVPEILQGSATLSNGFIIGPEKGRPASDQYVFLKPGHRFAGRSACPVSIYEESEFFRTVTLPWLKAQTTGSDADGIWVNWEPYSYARCGCMCEKCRAAFARYVGVSDEEMAKDWPQELAFGGKWHDRIARFRSIEHGKLCRTLSKHANVIFGIFWGEMSSAWRPRNLAAEVQAIDYAGSVKTISPWGPYPCWDTTRAYAKKDAICLASFCAAKDVRAQVNKDYAPPHRPRILALPSGCSFGCDWVGQPEWLFLQTMSFFLNGWESSYMCGFPRGYDARYWRAMALANGIAAKYENFVYDGRRTDEKVSLRTRRPFKVLKNVSSYLDWTKDGVPVVQAVAYELGGETFVAIVNFSEEEKAVVDLHYDGRLVEEGLVLKAPSLVVRVFR